MKVMESLHARAAGLTGLLLSTALAASANPAAAQANDLLYLGLSESAQATAADAVQTTLESVLSGEERHWRDPQGIEKGYIEPIRTFRNSDGQFCREYAEEVHRRDGVYRTQRIACRTQTGIWSIAGETIPVSGG